MATRRTIIDDITTALKGTFGTNNVSNRFVSAETLVSRSSGASAFPFLNVLLGTGSASFDSLGGGVEDEITCPINIIALTNTQGEDLHLDLVDLLDDIIACLKSQVNTASFNANCWYINNISWLPAEDEEYDEIGYLFIDVECGSTEEI